MAHAVKVRRLMGYKLRRELRATLPPGLLTSAERLVALEIADLANDDTREAWFGPEGIAEQVDMTSAAVRKHVQRMSMKGLEFRIPISEDKRGRPVYAHEGHQTNYRVPILRGAEGGQFVQPLAERVDNLSQEGGQNGSPRVDNPSTPSPHVSSDQTSSSSVGPTSTVRFVMTVLSVDEDEANEVIERVRTKHDPRNLAGYVRSMKDDLPEHLEAVRRERKPKPWPGSVPRDELYQYAACPHGNMGGLVPHPAHGQPWCAICRSAGATALSAAEQKMW